MTDGWYTTTLKDLCVVDWGNTNLTKSAYIEDGEFLAVSAAGCDGRIGHKEHSKGTPVLSAIGAQCGKMFFPEDDFTAIKNTITLTPRPNICDGKFLYYLFTFVELPQRGAGQPFISKGDIQSFSVSIPSLPEQKRIVAILDEAFAGIAAATANAEKNLANARELFTSYVSLIFSSQEGDWTALPLGEICENLDSRRIPITKSDRAEGDIPYYGASGIVDYVAEHIFDEDILLISEDGANLLARTYPIAFSVSGKCWVNNHAHVVRFTSMATQRIVEFYLNSISLAPYVSGMAQPKLNQKAMNSIIVPLPPQEDHARIVGQIEMIQEESKRLEDNYSQKLAALNELKQTILQKAFSGELTGIKTRHCEAA